VATSSGDAPFALKTAAHSRLFGLFHHIVKGSDVKNGKPAPDIYLKCAGQFDQDPPNPSTCLAFEDSVSGVKAALSAGMQVVMVPDPRMPEDLRSEATHVVADAHCFRPEAFGLPSFGYSTVTHVIFDLDGLLLDTGPVYYEADARAIARFGKKIDPEFQRTLLGMRFTDKVPKYIAHYGLPNDIREVFGSSADLIPALSNCKLLPGAERLIDHLHAKGIPMALATSSMEVIVKAKIEKHSRVFDKFSHLVCGCDPEVKQGKPSPDVFLTAARRFASPSPPAASCLVFEDADNGVAAAAAAGMQSVMVPGPNLVEPEQTLKATQLLATLEDFQPADFGLPEF
jgi:HAD superfamily hydrolase (TIGR01509 family)